MRTGEDVSRNRSDCNSLPTVQLLQFPSTEIRFPGKSRSDLPCAYMNNLLTYAFLKLCLDDIGTKHFLEVRDNYMISISGGSI